MRNMQGFTLVELMLVILIMSVLGAIAFSAYSQYRVKANRATAQSEMILIGQNMQSYRAANGTFSGATIATIYGSTHIPRQGTALYNLSFVGNPTAGGWVLMATPALGGRQTGTGVICLNELGHRYWEKTAVDCTKLSPVSVWDTK